MKRKKVGNFSTSGENENVESKYGGGKKKDKYKGNMIKC